MAKYLLGHSLRKTAKHSGWLSRLLRTTDLLCIGVPLTLLSWLPTDRARALDWYRKCRDSYRVLEKDGALGPQLAAELAAVEKKLGEVAAN